MFTRNDYHVSPVILSILLLLYFYFFISIKICKTQFILIDRRKITFQIQYIKNINIVSESGT